MLTVGYVKRWGKLASWQFGTLTKDMIRHRLDIGKQDNRTNARLLREKDLSLGKLQPWHVQIKWADYKQAA